jgi:hypothetical protein
MAQLTPVAIMRRPHHPEGMRQLTRSAPRLFVGDSARIRLTSNVLRLFLEAWQVATLRFGFSRCDMPGETRPLPSLPSRRSGA